MYREEKRKFWTNPEKRSIHISSEWNSQDSNPMTNEKGLFVLLQKIFFLAASGEIKMWEEKPKQEIKNSDFQSQERSNSWIYLGD